MIRRPGIVLEAMTSLIAMNRSTHLAAVLDLAFERHALFHVEALVDDAVESRLELAAFDLGEEAQAPEVHAEERRAGRAGPSPPHAAASRRRRGRRPGRGPIRSRPRRRAHWRAEPRGVRRERAHLDPARRERRRRATDRSLPPRRGRRAGRGRRASRRLPHRAVDRLIAGVGRTPRRRCRKNSRFPAGPTSGDAVAPASPHPASR